MKFFKYLTYSLALMLMVVSCDKNEILYGTEPAPEANLQLHYFEPVAVKSANYIDSVKINGNLVVSVKGDGAMRPRQSRPNASTTYTTYGQRWWAFQPGDATIEFYRKGEVVYNQTVTLTSGKQNVIVHDLDKAPIIIDNQYPYQHVSGLGSASTWGTDSLATIKFVNLLYEDAETPYSGKLQYQWKNPRTKEWENLGNPVAFGEATDRVPVLVVKTVFNSSGYCNIDYRILDENKEVLKVGNSSGKMSNYSDYWQANIGRSYMHFFNGTRLGGKVGPACTVTNWISL